MARTPAKKSPPERAEREEREPRLRGNPVTDYLDASEPLHRGGFDEALQRGLSGTPLSGSIADWASEISLAAEKEERPLAPAKEGTGKSPKPAKRIPERSAAPTRTGRGTSMGGAASAKERASAGLMPVAGLDVTLEEADTLSNSGVTATVAALTKLIEGGNPLHKD